jgi:hypothetical protein
MKVYPHISFKCLDENPKGIVMVGMNFKSRENASAKSGTLPYTVVFDKRRP